MAYGNPYAAYQTANVTTASQGKLVVLLYEGAIKNLKGAMACFEADDKILPPNIEKFGNFIVKTQDIINELQVSLDMDKGGQISQNLMSLYVFFNQELLSANINKDKKKIQDVLDFMNSLHQAWQIASTQSTTTPATPGQRALNIKG